ncbi:hypothetical protein MARPU_01505 [Marichromatium purpuratum 984]|uniref:Lipoprotein n=1 Tax=Marichromatium purpuratum 984 TaxID=765910 RepID=W0DVT1_MARPU|nr:hypothetical protein [Marichromatium purpuratum]AHF02670.1 hypothetical protein MARPU_01505 [Marichromatium purpuratum 984]
MQPRSSTPGFVSLVLAAVALALLTGGCATVEKDKRNNSLQAATYRHHTAIRWSYFDTAYGLLDPELRAAEPMPDLSGVRVTGYEVIRPLTLPDEDTANQLVLIDYLHEDTQVLRQVSDAQTWRWDAERETWWLHTGLPQFELPAARER